MQFQKDKLKLRIYQQSILNTASQHNTLVVIPTGLGKTLVAVALAALRCNIGKILFLAPTKPLCSQHEKTFRQFFEEELASELVTLTGEITPDVRKNFWSNSKIIFSTPQTAENDLLRRLLKPEDFSLLVIDEAHRAIGDYAYVWTAEQFCKAGVRILALTASPASETEKLNEIRQNLHIEKIEVRNDADADVVPYVKKKDIKKIMIDLPNEVLEVKACLESCLKERLLILKEWGVIESAEIAKARKVEFLKLQGSLARQNEPESFKALSVLASCIKTMHSIELIETQGSGQFISFVSELSKQSSKAAKNLLSDWNFRKAVALVSQIGEADHPKFAELRKIVEEHTKEKIIIFTQYRNGVEKIINEVEKIDGARPIAFVGQKEGMTQKKQMEAVEGFRDGTYNVLVATSVSEEGIDIPSVPVAIFFESVPSALRSIQRRGRVGRTDVGLVYLLITKGTIDEKYYWVAQHKEKRMGEILRGLKDSVQSKLTFKNI